MKVGQKPISSQEAAQIEKQLKSHAEKAAAAIHGSPKSPSGKPQDRPVKNNEGSQKHAAGFRTLLGGKKPATKASEHLRTLHFPQPDHAKIEKDMKAYVDQIIKGSPMRPVNPRQVTSGIKSPTVSEQYRVRHPRGSSTQHPTKPKPPQTPKNPSSPHL